MMIEHAILDVLVRSELPMKPAEITRLLKPVLGKAASPKAVAAALEALAFAGTLTRIAAGTAARPLPLFTRQSREAATAAFLKSWVHAAVREQQAVKLRAKLPGELQPYFEAALALLVAAGDAFVQSGGKRLVYAKRPLPTRALSAAQRTALQKILHTVNGLRSQPAAWEDLIAWLDEEPCTAAPPSLSIIAPTEAELQAWYELDRVRSSTLMIPIPTTYARYEAWATACGGMADNQVFRSFIERLYNEGRLLLEPCERPQDLPEQERALLVPMSLGPPGYSWCWIS